MWYVQFYHPHFGWLTLDNVSYVTKEQAEYAIKIQQMSDCPYKRRVIFLENTP